MATECQLPTQIEGRLADRNHVCEEFFAREALRLAEACREMSERFLRGGRLLAFGRGSHATDVQHVSVEFVHPVIVGKRALPALDLSIIFGPWLRIWTNRAVPPNDGGISLGQAALAAFGQFDKTLQS